MCNKRLGRKVPLGYIILGLITWCQAYLLSLITAEYTAESVFVVFLISSVGFLAATVYALTTKVNIQIHYSMAFGAMASLLTVSILLIFTRVSGLLILYSFIGTLVTLLFVVIDTEIIINERKYGIGYDDFILAALLLYLDFI